MWRKPNGEFNKKNLAASVKYGAGSQMVFGCMSGADVGNLQSVDDIMDKYVYLIILKQDLIQSAKKRGYFRLLNFTKVINQSIMRIFANCQLYITAHNLTKCFPI